MKTLTPPFSVQLDHINAICQAAMAQPDLASSKQSSRSPRLRRDYDQFEAFSSSRPKHPSVFAAG